MKLQQLTLFDLQTVDSPFPIPVYDPAWDEETMPQHEEPEQRWKEADFGEVPRKIDDGGQVSIFYDDSVEPPDPDDFSNQTEFNQAWGEWESARVLERDTSDTRNRVLEQKTPGYESSTDVPEHIKAVPEHIKAVPEHLHWVEKYCPSNRKDNHYYRYCWKTGRKIKHRHITGGNVRSQLAQSRKADIEVWISDGLEPVEIEKLMRSWRIPDIQHPMPDAE